MRISRRTSGGRGEYEISEQASNGITPKDLFGRRIFVVFEQGWTVDSGVQLTFQGGKRRLRMLDAAIQLQRQVAAALLLPHSVRADAPLGRGIPILQSNRYAIEHIEVTEVELLNNDAVRFRIQEVILRNLSHHAEELRYPERLAEINHIWNHRAELPEYLSILIEQHRGLTRAGTPIPADAERLVSDLQRLVTENGVDLGIAYRSEGEDVVPDLLKTLKAAEIPPAPPIAVEAVDPDATEIRRRTVREWKRWAASRGAASARFRQAVRRAWRSTCAVCGLHLPPTAFNAVAGVDAAHILPWADYDLDHVSNGICLCKHHHWAFDEGLLVITSDDSGYRVEIPTDIVAGIRQENAAFGLDSLQRFEGLIPVGRLPHRHEDRPNPRYLELLRENS